MNAVWYIFPVSGHEYESISTTVRAMPCQPVICAELTIIDDDTVELLEKTFTVQLERTAGLDYRISLEDTPATMTITDDDGMGAHYKLCPTTFPVLYCISY